MSRPAAYVKGLQFGKVPSPVWVWPPDGIEAGLTAAVIQHCHAAAIIAALHAKSMTRKTYAEAISRGQSMVGKYLNGHREMRVSDIADAVDLFGVSVLPASGRIEAELARARSLTGLT